MSTTLVLPPDFSKSVPKTDANGLGSSPLLPSLNGHHRIPVMTIHLAGGQPGTETSHQSPIRK
jgi:hypothetical protein